MRLPVSFRRATSLTNAIALTVSAFGLASYAPAAVVTWNGASTNDLGTAGNWVGGVNPSASVPDTATWNGVQAGNLSLVYSNTAFAGAAGNLGISMATTASQTGSLTIDSGANTGSLRMNNVTLAASSGAFTMGDGAATFNLTLGGATNQTHTWSNSSSNAATINSDVKFGLGGGGNHALLFTGSGNWNVNAAVTPLANNLSIQKTGAGTLTLSGGGSWNNNSAQGTVVTAFGGVFGATFKEGLTKITAGTYSSAAEVVVGGLDTTGTNTTLQLDAGSLSTTSYLSVGRGNGTGTVSSDVILNNGATLTATNFSGGYNAGNATTTPKGSITLNNTATMTLGSGGNINIAESANSNITVTTNNTSTFNALGDIRLGQGGTGKLVLNGTSTVNVATTAEKWFIMGMNAGGNGQLDVNGGTLRLNTNTDLRYTTSSGANGTNTVNLNSGSIVGVTGNNNGVLSGTSVVDMNNASTVATINNTFNLNGGTLGIGQVISSNTTGNATFNFNGGTIQAAASSTAFLSMGGANQKFVVKSGGAIIDSNTFNITAVNGLLDGTGGGGLTKSSAGTLTLSGASTYTGATTVNGGALNLTGSLTSNIIAGNTTTVLGSGTTTGSLTLNAGSTISADATGAFLKALNVNIAGTASYALTGTITTGNTYTIVDYGAGGAVTGLANLTGSLRGTPVNNAGAHQIQITVLGVGNRTWNTTNGTWDVNGATNWLEGDQKFFAGDTVFFSERPAASAVTLSGSLAPVGTVTVDNTTNGYAFSGSGSITGSASLTKNNAGSLNIANANTYTGGTNLNGGTLVLDNASAIGTGALNIAGGAIDSSNGTTLTTNNVVNASGNFSFTGTSNLNLGTGLVTLSGGDRAINLGGNTLTVGKITSTAGGLSLSGAGTLVATSTGTGGSGTSLSGTLNVGSGTTFQYNRTGNTGANSGDLSVAGLAGTGTIVNGAGDERWVFVNNAATSTFSGTLANGGTGGLGLNKSGAGSLVLNGSLNYTGLTTLNAGTLAINAANSSAGTNVNIPAAATLVIGNTAALGTASLVNFNAINGTTIAFASDGGDNLYKLKGGTGANITFVSDRTTAGSGTNHTFTTEGDGISGFGGGTYNFISGANNTNGSITINLLGLSAGSVQNYTLNPTTANVIIGDIHKSLNNPNGTVVLDGTSAGNQVTGTIANGPTSAVISVTKSNSSTWTLSGTNTYTGSTSITGGKLVVNGSIVSNVTISGTGVLAGSGTIGGTIAYAGGTLAPGNSPGTLTMSNSLTLDGATTLAYDVNGADMTVGGGINDLTTGVTNLTLDGTLNVTETVAGSFLSAVYGNTWRLINYSGTITDNTLDIGSMPTLSGGLSFAIDSTTPGQINLTVVPEPTTLAVVGLGFGAMLRRRRRVM